MASADLGAQACCHGNQPLPGPLPVVGNYPVLKHPVVCRSQPRPPPSRRPLHGFVDSHTLSLCDARRPSWGPRRGWGAGTHWHIHSPVAAEAARGVAATQGTPQERSSLSGPEGVQPPCLSLNSQPASTTATRSHHPPTGRSPPAAPDPLRGKGRAGERGWGRGQPVRAQQRQNRVTSAISLQPTYRGLPGLNESSPWAVLLSHCGGF